MNSPAATMAGAAVVRTKLPNEASAGRAVSVMNDETASNASRRLAARKLASRSSAGSTVFVAKFATAARTGARPLPTLSATVRNRSPSASIAMRSWGLRVYMRLNTAPIAAAAVSSAPIGVSTSEAVVARRRKNSMEPFTATTAPSPMTAPFSPWRTRSSAGETSPLMKSARPCRAFWAMVVAAFSGSAITPMIEAPKSAKDSFRFATRPESVLARSSLAPTRRWSFCRPVMSPFTNRSDVISPASCISTSCRTLPPVSWSARIWRMLRPGRFSASWLSSSPCRRPADTT